MRDIKRIERILNKIDDLWQENPDLRLCQLIYKILGESKYLSDQETAVRKMLVKAEGREGE